MARRDRRVSILETAAAIAALVMTTVAPASASPPESPPDGTIELEGAVGMAGVGDFGPALVVGVGAGLGAIVAGRTGVSVRGSMLAGRWPIRGLIFASAGVGVYHYLRSTTSAEVLLGLAIASGPKDESEFSDTQSAEGLALGLRITQELDRPICVAARAMLVPGGQIGYQISAAIVIQLQDR